MTTSLDSLASMMKLFGSSNTTTTDVKQTKIDQATLQGILKNALESNSGLSSITHGQNTAGMYNSTTNAMLVNDLLSRLTTQTAALSAPTTTTRTAKTPAAIGGSTVAALAGASLFKPELDNLLKKGKTSLLDKLTGASDSVSSGIASASNSAAWNEVPAALQGIGPGDYAVGELAGGLDLATELGGVVETGAELGELGTIAETGMEVGGLGTLAEIGMELGGLAEIGAGLDLSLGELGAAEGLGELGLLEGAGSAVSALGEILMTALAWVICTELKASGELDSALYEEGAKHIASLPPAVIRGYHWWAIPYTRLMRKYKFARTFIKPWAIGRAKYLAGEKNFLGWLTVVIGEPVCGFLGHTVARKSQDWEALYTKGN